MEQMSFLRAESKTSMVSIGIDQDGKKAEMKTMKLERTEVIFHALPLLTSRILLAQYVNNLKHRKVKFLIKDPQKGHFQLLEP